MTNNSISIKRGLPLARSVFASFLLAAISMPSIAQQEADMSAGLQEAMRFCSNMTDENKRMARAVGYDIGKLCKSLSSLDFDAVGAEKDADELILPRKDEPGRATESNGEDFADSESYDDSNSTDDQPFQYVDVDEESGELQPFGYELFAGEPTTFAPANQIPVSPDYLLGPGDNLKILFYGKTNDSMTLEINRNGSVDFPQLGPVNLTGMTFADAKKLIKVRISEQMIGVQASISLGELRSIQIFVLGSLQAWRLYSICALYDYQCAVFEWRCQRYCLVAQYSAEACR